MSKRLIVADSAAKIEVMKSYYGGDADGLLCQWPLFAVGIQPDANAAAKVKFRFEALPEANELITTLATNQHQEIIILFNQDSTGDLLAWQLQGYAGQRGIAPNIRRLSPAGFSQQEIAKSLETIAAPDPKPGQTVYIRTLFDDYLARHLQRLLGTDRGPGNLLLRHQSLAVLFLLNERHQGQAMHQNQRWHITGHVAMPGGHGVPVALSKGLNLPANGLFADQNKAQALATTLRRHVFKVDAVSRVPFTLPPPAPYRLAELIQDGSIRLGLSPRKVMAIVEALYNGVPVQGQNTGLITAWSAATPPPCPATLSSVRQQAAALFGQSTLATPIEPKAGMIVPLPVRHDALNLNKDQAAIYDLIRHRAIASQMNPGRGESLTVDFLVGKEHIFQARFHELADPGFLQALPEQMAPWQSPCPIREIATGQKFESTIQCEPNGKESRGPKPYTIDSLFADLADFAITPEPAAFSQLDALTSLGYATISEHGVIEPTPQTAQVATILGRAFPRMQGLNLAAYIEQTIAEATTGRKDLTFALKQFDQTLMLHGKTLVKAKVTLKPPTGRPRLSTTIIRQSPATPEDDATASPDAAPPASAAQSPPAILPGTGEGPEVEIPAAAPETDIAPSEMENPADELPPAAEGEWTEPPPQEEQGESDSTAPMSPPDTTPPEDLLKLFAEALADDAPRTDATATHADPIAEPEPPTAQAPATARPASKDCPACGKAMVIRKDQFGTYWGCTGFPACRHSESTAASPCPLCGQPLTTKQTSTGKQFYTCTDTDCQFMSWSSPHYIPCGLCDSPYLVEKTVQGIPQLRCPKAGCSYAQPLPESSTPEAAPQAGPGKVMVRRTATGSGPAPAGVKKVRVVRRRS